MPRVSRRSANDKGDNEMITGAMLRSPGIYHTGEEDAGKPQQGDVDEGCATCHRFKWDPGGAIHGITRLL